MSTVFPVRALIVDDSAFVRKIVREILTTAGIDVVGTARDGVEALEMVESLRPDVVTCDLLMPRLDGLGFVKKQMALRPLPILVLSAEAQDAGKVVEALNAGAVDLVKKPSALATDDLRAVGAELVAKVRACVSVRAVKLVETILPAAPLHILPHTSKADIVVIGISTGGPQALRRIMPLFPADFPVPIAIVLHMPVGYTALYAESLNALCALEVKEASEGAIFKPGIAFLARAGRHLCFARDSAGQVVAQLPVQPLEKIHRPSVDVLFRSAAELFKDRVLAVVMTGMGDDGTEGAGWIKAQGGTVITEAENSCIIYGMPRSVVEAGLSDLSVPLCDLTSAITQCI